MCSTICSTVTLKCFCVLCFYNMVAFFPYQKIQSSLILYSSSLQGWWMVSMDLGWWHFVGIIHCIGGKKTQANNLSQHPHCWRRLTDVTSSSCCGLLELAGEELNKPYCTDVRFCVYWCCCTFWKQSSFVLGRKTGWRNSNGVKTDLMGHKSTYYFWGDFYFLAFCFKYSKWKLIATEVF